MAGGMELPLELGVSPVVGVERTGPDVLPAPPESMGISMSLSDERMMGAESPDDGVDSSANPADGGVVRLRWGGGVMKPEAGVAPTVADGNGVALRLT